MPRACSICRHSKRCEIDSSMVNGESLRNVAKQFHVSSTAIFRHKRDHIPPMLLKAAEADLKAREILQGDQLLEQVRDLNERTLRILQEAEKAGDSRTALVAIREARGNSELLCKMIIAIEAAKNDEREPERPVGEVLESITLALFGRRRQPAVESANALSPRPGESQEDWKDRMVGVAIDSEMEM